VNYEASIHKDEYPHFNGVILAPFITFTALSLNPGKHLNIFL